MKKGTQHLRCAELRARCRYISPYPQDNFSALKHLVCSTHANQGAHREVRKYQCQLSREAQASTIFEYCRSVLYCTTPLSLSFSGLNLEQYNRALLKVRTCSSVKSPLPSLSKDTDWLSNFRASHFPFWTAKPESSAKCRRKRSSCSPGFNQLIEPSTFPPLVQLDANPQLSPSNDLTPRGGEILRH